jgi:very-short-patch-repair endonuclease
VHDDEDQAAHDAVRDAVLAREGFLTERFTNAEVLDDLSLVMLTIRKLLEQRLTMPSPPGEGGSPKASRVGNRPPPP